MQARKGEDGAKQAVRQADELRTACTKALKHVLCWLHDVKEDTFFVGAFPVSPRRAAMLDPLFQHHLPHLGVVMVSSTCQTKFGVVKAGDMVRLRLQKQWGVAFLIFCAAGAELASSRA